MWNALKNLISGAQETLGVELPALPVDLGFLGDGAAAAQDAVDSATGAVDGAAGAVDGVVAAGGEAATDAAAQATAALE